MQLDLAIVIICNLWNKPHISRKRCHLRLHICSRKCYGKMSGYSSSELFVNGDLVEGTLSQLFNSTKTTILRRRKNSTDQPPFVSRIVETWILDYRYGQENARFSVGLISSIYSHSELKSIGKLSGKLSSEIPQAHCRISLIYVRVYSNVSVNGKERAIYATMRSTKRNHRPEF